MKLSIPVSALLCAMSLGAGAAPIDVLDTISSLVDRSSSQESQVNQGSQGSQQNQESRSESQNQQNIPSQPQDSNEQDKNQLNHPQGQNQHNKDHQNSPSQANQPTEQNPSQQDQQNQNNQQSQQHQQDHQNQADKPKEQSQPSQSHSDPTNIITNPSKSTNHDSHNSQAITIITDTQYDRVKSLIDADLIEGTTYAFTIQQAYDDSESNSPLKTLTKDLGFKDEFLLVGQLTSRSDHGNTYLGFDGTVFQLQIQNENTLRVQSAQSVWTDSLEGLEYAFLKTTKRSIAEIASQGASWVSNHPTFQYDVKGTNFGTYIQNLISLL